MLFLQDDLRVHSGSYAILPAIDLEKVDSSVRELEDLCRASRRLLLQCASSYFRKYLPLCFEHA